MRDQSQRLRRQVERVVRRGNCSGCGACAALSSSLRMELDRNGYSRPSWTEPKEPEPAGAAARFRAVCPGVAVTAPRPPGTTVHPTMGPYVSVWAAWATDPDVRFRGSSAGVLTALTLWLLETGRANAVTGSSMSEQAPVRTVALQLRSKEEVLGAAGSRYAPVSNAQIFDAGDRSTAFVGKPCEVSAARQMSAVLNTGPSDSEPILLSFFCAGVPSQHATEELTAHLGVPPNEVASLRYRGDGWPGSFSVRSRSGSVSQLSYEESWGEHLGRRLQSRCKICPDGTGGHADIAVGDFWEAGTSGYPVFDDAEGMSVAIARNRRGHRMLMSARDSGVVGLSAATLDAVAGVQPLQVSRRMTLLGRVIGRWFACRPGPRYRGFALWRLAASWPRESLVAAIGTYRRTRGEGRS